MAISIRSTATSRTTANATLTLDTTKPTGVISGDILVAIAVVGDSGSTEPEISAPAGWTTIREEVDFSNGPLNYLKLVAFWRLATGSEPSSYTFTTSTATASRFAVTINAYIGVDTSAPIALSEVSSYTNGTNGSSTQRPAGSITTTDDRWIIASVADRNNSTFTAPNPLVQRALTNGQSPAAIIADSNGYVTTGTHSYTFESSTSSSTCVGLIFSLVDGSATSPVINVQRPAANLVDLRNSIVGDGSTLTYRDPVRVSGPTLTWSRLTSNIFLFTQSTGTTPSVYNFIIEQANNQTAQSEAEIAPASSGSVNISAPRRPSGPGTGTSWV